METEQTITYYTQISNGFKFSELEKAILTKILFKNEERKNDGVEHLFNNQIYGPGNYRIVEQLTVKQQRNNEQNVNPHNAISTQQLQSAEAPIAVKGNERKCRPKANITKQK